MGVQLNIKDPETVRLARELARASGRSVTMTVRAALEQVAADRDTAIRERIATFDRLVDEFRANAPAEWEGRSSKDIMDDLYDEDGLPT